MSQFCKKIDVYSSGSFSPNELNNIKSIEKKFKNINTFIDKSTFQTIKKTRVLDENNKKVFEIYHKKGNETYSLTKSFLEILSIKNLKNMIVLFYVILATVFLIKICIV